MSQTPLVMTNDTWIPATWEDYLRALDDPIHAKSKGYYRQGQMRLEMQQAVGFDHSKDHSVISLVINLYSILNAIPFTELDNCSFRKSGYAEFQPDLAYYVGAKASTIPSNTGVVNLNRYAVPDLVVEVSKSSLLDDRTVKRRLYEEMGIAEYWIAAVETGEVLAYPLSKHRSKSNQILEQSLVFPGLAIATLNDALQKSRTLDQSQVGAWLMAQFQEQGF